MEFLIPFILISTLIPVFKPFGSVKSDKRGLPFLFFTYSLYLLTFLTFWHFSLFQDMHLGYELGDIVYYFIFTLTMVIANLSMGFRNKMGVEFRYFISAIILIANIWMISMIFQSNLFGQLNNLELNNS